MLVLAVRAERIGSGIVDVLCSRQGGCQLYRVQRKDGQLIELFGSDRGCQMAVVGVYIVRICFYLDRLGYRA